MKYEQLLLPVPKRSSSRPWIYSTEYKKVMGEWTHMGRNKIVKWPMFMVDRDPDESF